MTKNSEKEGFIAVTGGKIWYKIVGEEKGIPLIVLHGGPGSAHDYLDPLKELSNGRQVIFYDQLGCGNSERPNDLNLWTVKRFVSELSQIIKFLKLKKYNILGHSWGSALALNFALTKPRGLNSIIFADPYIDSELWDKDAKELIKQLPIKTQSILNKHNLKGITQTNEFKNASKEYYKKFVYRFNRKPRGYPKSRKKNSKIVYEYMWGIKEFAVSGTLKNHNISSKLSELKLPVLFLCGRFDEATPESTRYFKNLTPNSQIKIFEKSAHLPHWTERKEYIKTVRNFLKGVEKEYEN